MVRILRAFAWLRWRTLLNSLERSTSRDLVERFALGIDQLSPLLLAIVMIPSAASVAITGAVAGWKLGVSAGENAAFAAIRLVLLGAVALSVLGPLLFRAGGQLPALRLRLLPVPSSVLYLAQALSVLADPWILLALAAVLALPVGLGLAAAAGAAAAALAAGLLLIIVLAGLNAMASAVLQLLLRNRRRGEMLALLGMLLLVVIGLLPGLLDSPDRPETRGTAGAEPGPASSIPLRIPASGLVPSEWYAAAIEPAERAGAGRLEALGTLAAAAGMTHGIAFLLFARLWTSPGVSTGGGRGRAVGTGRLRLPGLSPTASAIAVNQVRLALRTPRGRSTILSPTIMFGALALLLMRSPTGTPFTILSEAGGIGLAVLGVAVSLLAVLPLAVNQFAIDGAGLTLSLLTPIETRALLAGKAAGTGIVAALPAALCTAAAAVLFPGGHPAFWAGIPLWFLGTWLLAAPAAAALSAVFPRAVDLSSIGSGSNAHGLATLLGMAAAAAAAAPPAVIAVLASRAVAHPAIVPLLLVLWCGVAFGLSALLFRGAGAVFERRRENLALIRARG